MKSLAVLGATGSVGRQALEVAYEAGHEVKLLAAGHDILGMEKLIRAYRPRVAVMADLRAAEGLAMRVAGSGTKVLAGEGALLSAIASAGVDVTVNAILGAAGLRPTLAALDAGQRVALANKESLVIAGDIIREKLKTSRGEIIPVDSEHSAIFQCLKAGAGKEVKRLLLTASGGPFRGYTKERLEKVTLTDTLAHPTWKMGKKITVDSATLMNKGFEIIEATHLFGVGADRVEVVVHPESIIHSAVEYIDNAVIAELSVPDMRMCVEYAISYPERCPSIVSPLDLFAVGKLTFERPDPVTFPLLSLARRAATDGGGMGAVMNAADEVAVAAFLEERIPFHAISTVVEDTYAACLDRRADRTLDGRFDADRTARRLAEERVASIPVFPERKS